MEIKYIYLLALVSILIVGYFYVDEVDEVSARDRTSSTRDYQAHTIHFTQSDAKGELQATLSADELVHYMQDDRSELRQINAVLYHDNQIQSTFSSDLASMTTRGGEKILTLSHQVELQDLQNAVPLRLTADSLTANLTQKTIISQSPVTINNGHNQLIAQAVTGNLKTQEYQLNGIKATLQPSRIKPL